MMNKLIIIATIFLVLVSGCTSQRNKTKEQLVSEGVKMSQENNPGAAAIFFKNALDKDPNYFEARFLLAKAYFALGKIDAAEKELQKVRRQNPSSRDVQIEIARIMVSTDRADDALKELSSYLGDNSTDCDAMDVAGQAYAVKEDYPVAISLLKKSMTVCEGRSSSAISLAAVYAMMGNLGEAEHQLTRVLEKEPTNRKALYLLSDVQTRREDRASALKTLDRLIQANENDIEAKYRKGLLYLGLGEYDKSLSLSSEIIKQFPKRSEGYRLQGAVLFNKKQYREAVGVLQKSLVIQPNAGAYYVLGICHDILNEVEQASNQFQKALEINPSFTDARIHFAIMLIKKKRVDEAITELKRVISQDDDVAIAHSVLASAYLAKGNYTEGMTELNKALALDPTLADVHVEKGLLAMRRGQHAEAESELVAAVRTKPEALETRRMLVLFYINNNEPAKAIEVLKKGIQNGQTDAVSYYLLAEAYLRQNNLSEATTFYLKAKEADPKNDLAYFRLASLYFIQGKQDQSVQELQNLLGQSPNNVQALLQLASIAELNGDENEAQKYMLKAADTGKPEGIVAAARYLQRKGNSDKALRVLDDGIKQAPSDDNLQLMKGEILLANKKYKDAIATFEIVNRRNPQIGFDQLVNAFLVSGEPAKALEKVQDEIKKSPTNLLLRAYLSRLYLAMGKKDKAVENARDIIQKNPEVPVGYVTLAFVYQDSNEIDKCIDVLRSASKVKDASIAYNLGNLYVAKKNYKAALEQSGKAERLKPRSAQILIQKATILYALGKRREAEAEYQNVLRLSPNHPMALNNLAYLYAQENTSLSQALTYASRAFMIAPQNDSIRDTLGYVLLKNGKTDRALRVLKQASESSPKNPDILYHLALAYKESGDQTKAVEHLQKAIDLGEFAEITEARLLLSKMKKNGKT